MSNINLPNDTEIANEAIKLMITNDWDACEKLLLKHRSLFLKIYIELTA
jgi:hypothetical protein